MPIDEKLLEILVCPETHQRVSPAERSLIDTLNGKVSAGALRNRQGQAVSRPIEEGLVREDGGCVYVVEDGIPNMLIEERIDL